MKFIIYLVFIILFINYSSIIVKSEALDLFHKDFSRNITQLIQARGYEVEQHYTITKDGYILSLQRIPNERYKINNNPYGSNGKPSVLLMHGVEDLGTTWVNQENVDQSLGFILADSGFDVWICNVRGTRYSNTHVKYSLYDNEYWDFTFDDMAKHDLPSSIELVLNVSGNNKTALIGHSQATMIFFISHTYNKKMFEKVNLFIGLAPIARVTHCKSNLLKTMAALKIDQVLKVFGGKSFLFHSDILRSIFITPFCSMFPTFCMNSLSLIEGIEDTSNLNITRLPFYLSSSVGGTSVKNVIHWAQNYKYSFQNFDYGTNELNFEKYGTSAPPKYNLSNVDHRIPIVTFSGDNDYLSNEDDVDWLLPQLPSLVYHKQIKTFSHVDFVWSYKAKELVYKDIIFFLLKYSSNK